MELHETLDGFFQERFGVGGNALLALLHAFVAGKQQGFGLGVFFLG
jgi:hypothetical protein